MGAEEQKGSPSRCRGLFSLGQSLPNTDIQCGSAVFYFCLTVCLCPSS